MAVSRSISNLGKSPFVFSAGEWAKQADGSVCVSYGDTVVLATACMSKEASAGVDFFPLTVEYQERTYAMGKIPGGFIKKEGRPKDEEILNARLIDRPLRPLFPKGLTHEVQIIAMVLSSDGQNDPDILAVNAASCALFISDIPFDKPVGAVRVSKISGTFVINPTYEERNLSAIDLVAVGTEEKIVMLEGGLNEAKEEDIVEAIRFAHPFIRELIAVQRQLRQQIGKNKRSVNLFKIDEAQYGRIKERVGKNIGEIYSLTGKEEKQAAIDQIVSSLADELVSEYPRLPPIL